MLNLNKNSIVISPNSSTRWSWDCGSYTRESIEGFIDEEILVTSKRGSLLRGGSLKSNINRMLRLSNIVEDWSPFEAYYLIFLLCIDDCKYLLKDTYLKF